MLGPTATTGISSKLGSSLTFVATLAANYLLSRLSAQDGPRLENLQASGGDYGVAIPRAYGSQVRVPGIFIAQADIRETKHKVEDYSEIAGAIGGAAIGFKLGGPVGAGIGAVAGGLLGFATPDQKYYTYSDTFAHLLLDRTDQPPIEGVLKIWANGKLIFSQGQPIVSEAFDVDGNLIRRKYGKNKYFKSLTIQAGHTDQDVDPILAAQVGEDSAYIFSALCVIEDLQLAPFGNSLPSSIDYLVQVQDGETFADAAEHICSMAGIDPEREMSSTALIGDTLRGVSFVSETTCWDALKPLLPAFGVDCAEVSGQVRFYRRSQSMRAVIPTDHMGAHMFGDSPPNKLSFRRDGDLALPQQTSLTFIDPQRDFQPNTASTPPNVDGDARSNVVVTIPVVLEASEGARAAALMHWDAWLGRTSLNFTLTDQWIGLETGLAYGIPFGGTVVPYRITRKLRGANGIIEVEALSDESVTYTATVDGSSGTMPDEESTDFPDTRLIIIDGSIQSDSHDDYGFYIVQGASAGGWTRGRIEVSSDGISFVTIIDSPLDAVMGDVTGTLAAGTTDGLDDTLDTTTELFVETLHSGMTFESATDAELDLWKNFIFVGKNGQGEYLQFKTPTQLGPTSWKFTNLRRGRRGTDWAISTHTSGEEFAVLGGGGVFRIVYSDTSQWGEEYTFRGVTLHQDADDAAEQAFTNTGEGKRPFSPVNIEGSWDGSNNLTVTWDSRSRLFAGGLGIDDNAEWDIEFFGTPNHTETVSSETATFSAAEQTSAGLTPGDTVTGRVRQTSDVNDGRWRNFEIIGPNALTFDSSLTFDETSYTWDAG